MIAEKFPIEKVVKLLTTAKDLHGKIGEILAEVDDLLGGKAGIGSEMKALEQAFDAIWCERYAPGTTGRYVWRYKIDKPSMKRLIKTLGLGEAVARIGSYLRNEEPFYVRARHSFGIFVSSINSHQGLTSGAAPDLAVGDCHHVPRCLSDQQHTKRRAAEMRA